MRPRQALKIELVAIPFAIALVAVVVFVVFDRKTHNSRPLGGANVLVTRGADQGEQLSFASGRDGVFFGATNSLIAWSSRNGGRTWTRGREPDATCGFGWPRAVVAPDGRETLAFLVSTDCDRLRPYLAVASRSGPDAPWSAPVRVAPALYKWGFDDAPSLAVDPRNGDLYAAWSRNLDARRTTVVTSRSDDGGRTWSTPLPVSTRLEHPHRAQIAVASDGTVYTAGIDVRYGIWVARSSDGGRTFGTPVRAAPLLGNPSLECGLTGFTPIPSELRSCEGPDPTLLVDRGHVLVVYDDFGANQTQDVLAAALDARLHVRFRAHVSPPDHGRSAQFLPTAAADPDTGAFWACWYDSSYEKNGLTFTCSASRTGRVWTPPERAAADPSPTSDFGFVLGKAGIYPSLVAAHGVAHPFWLDTHVIANGDDVYTAALPERAAFASAKR